MNFLYSTGSSIFPSCSCIWLKVNDFRGLVHKPVIRSVSNVRNVSCKLFTIYAELCNTSLPSFGPVFENYETVVNNNLRFIKRKRIAYIRLVTIVAFIRDDLPTAEHFNMQGFLLIHLAW